MINSGWAMRRRLPLGAERASMLVRLSAGSRAARS